jgi:hypothetical protein
MFYEIDPAVARIARDRRLFTYLADSRAERTDVVLGDARLRLREAPDRSYDLIVLDAFSSDAIPAHLLTREAIGLYRAKLAPDGLIAVHISSRFLDLRRLLAAQARDAGLIGRVRLDPIADRPEGKTTSVWAVLAPPDADLGPIEDDPRWTLLAARASDRAWTDDFIDILGAFRR